MQNNIKNIDIIKNIWFDKIYRTVFIAVITLSIFSHFTIHKYVFEQFYNELMVYVLNEAKQVGNHIAVHQGNATKAEVLQIAMNRMLSDFDIMKIRLFDKDGIIIHSTKLEEIGNKNNHEYFYNIVKKGQMFYKIVKSEENSLEDEKQKQDVAEIYVPIMEDGQFVGASEIYYDITYKRTSLNKLIDDTDRVFMFIIIFSQITILTMLYFASKNSLIKKLNDKKAKEIEDVMNKQARSIALADMIGNVAHHWRQPLSVITTAISGLTMINEIKGSISNEELLEVSDIIVKTSQNLSNTIDNFRDLITDDNENVHFNISENISKSIELFKMTNSNINCNFELHMDKDIYYKGVESKLTRVVINILNNSYESFNKNNIENKKIAILLKNIDGFINLKITDNAGGIEPSIINKIFDPYFTTKHQYQDTGLGLFICLRIIVDNFDGNIICKNIDIKSEKGCEFLITIPVQVS